MIIDGRRVRLVSISREHAARIVAGRPAEGERWHPEYPFADELDPLRGLADGPEPDPVFTMYQVRTRDDGLAVGGLGFFGPPDDDGSVEVGYGLIAAARGHGYATDALLAAIAVARAHGARRIIAGTERANQPSQAVLRRAGFAEIGRDSAAVRFAVSLPEAGPDAE